MEEKKMKRKFFSVGEFYQEMGGIITKGQIYKMIKAGEIPTRKIGNKVVLSADWVHAYINQPCVAVRQSKDNIVQ